MKPSHAKEGVGQLKSYMAACANCEWGMWTNSETKFVFRKVKGSDGKWTFEEFIDIPPADGSPSDLDRPDRKKLRDASDDNLLFVFRTCHDYIHVTDGLQEEEAFFEFLKVIFCKIEDERNVPKPLEFFATNAERGDPDGQLTVKKRIAAVFSRVKSLPKYRRIFAPSDEIGLKPRSLAHVVAELQGCTHILHAGDIVRELDLDELSMYGSIYAVRGNNDTWVDGLRDLAGILRFEIAGVSFLMVHDRRDVPRDLTGVQAVICGHTHRYSEEWIDGRLWLNPGTCGRPRWGGETTMARLTLREGKILRVQKIVLPD